MLGLIGFVFVLFCFFHARAKDEKAVQKRRKVGVIIGGRSSYCEASCLGRSPKCHANKTHLPLWQWLKVNAMKGD